MKQRQPIQIGDLLSKLFIVRPDGTTFDRASKVDHDMVVALAQAAHLHEEARKLETQKLRNTL